MTAPPTYFETPRLLAGAFSAADVAAFVAYRAVLAREWPART